MAKKSKVALKAKKVTLKKKPSLRNIIRRPRKKIAVKLASMRLPVKKEKELLGADKLSVETTKFYTGQTQEAYKPRPSQLPASYDQDKIVLMIRDPWWLYTYWEVRPKTIDKLKDELKERFNKAKLVLRVYDVSNIIFNGKNAHRFFDIEVNHYINNWYINAGAPGRSWCVDLGLLLADGSFITIIRSNTVSSPLDGPSWITDEEWMIPDDLFAKLYGLGFGFGRSSPSKAWQERMKKALFSGVLSSPGISSSPVKKIPPRERKFWLVVNTELIVYGATEPDAKVTVQDREIKLRPDGTFTLRFALPDGRQDIPVKAVSSDKEEERTITPIVVKKTK